MPDHDAHLLDQLKSGDEHAYETIFRKYYKPLSLQAFYLLGDDMEAEDLVQQVFIDFWQKQQYNNIATSLKAYLSKTIYNSCLNLLEKRKSRSRKLEAYLREAAEKTTFATERAERYEKEKYVETMLRSLPVQQGEAFNLVYMEDKKYRDAAGEMGISVNSVKTHLRLAIKNLGARLKNK